VHPQLLQPRPDCIEGAVQLVGHVSILPFGKDVCKFASGERIVAMTSRPHEEPVEAGNTEI
jgi:hypothetical protein